MSQKIKNLQISQNFPDWCFHNFTGELALGVFGIDTRSSLENLDNSFISRHFQHLTRANRAVQQLELYNFSIFCVLKFKSKNISNDDVIKAKNPTLTLSKMTRGPLTPVTVL